LNGYVGILCIKNYIKIGSIELDALRSVSLGSATFMLIDASPPAMACPNISPVLV
jgi:hypothetical protein